MIGPGRLEAIEVRVTCAEFAGSRYEPGSIAVGQIVPPTLRDLATWHVASCRPPTDFSDSIIVRLVPR